MLNEKRLTEIMRVKGVTNAELATGIGVSASSMTYYRQGLRIPSAVTLGRIANYLGCKMDDIWVS
jgi:transcriptional regulator with XRE-family HTH domain